MQFRFFTEVNEGNKDVSGSLKSPSLPSFPSVFPITTFFVCRSEGNIPKAGSIVDPLIAEDNNRCVLAIRY